MAMGNSVLIWCFCLVSLRVSKGLNLDFEFPVIKQGPPGSLFGFSVEQHEFTPTNAAPTQRVLIGAPKGSNKYQKSVNSPGTVYKCDPTSVSPSCEDEVPFDIFGNSPDGFEDKSNQWFGVSIKSGGSNKPVLACAHRYLFKTSGKNFHLYEGTCHTATASLGRGEIYSPCNELNANLARSATVPSYQNSGQCLAGIGADIVEFGNQREYLIGTVGYTFFQGAVFRMPQQEDDGTPGASKSDYNRTDAGLIGYSVDHGTFFDKNRVDMASGGPRTSSNGMVLLLRKQKNVNASGFSLKVIQSLPADSDQVQIGSSFGFAVRAVDSDKDGLSELLVGAPFHADPSFPGHGMVYYYKNNGAGKLSLKGKFSVKGPRSNFGSAIASVGDLDLDGYNDAVIGAPFENDGQGAIYVFRGSENGLQVTPSQKITASEVKPSLLGFGRSLAGGYDLDNNGYKDVLVGAFASDSAVLLRSRPVIEIVATIQFRNDVIDPSSGDPNNPPEVMFRLCRKYIEKSGKVNGVQRAFMRIEVDPGIPKRLLLSITDTATAEGIFEVDRAGKCTSYTGYFQYRKDGSYSVYPDISLVVTYRLEKDADRKPQAVDGKLTSLDTYAVLSPSSSRSITAVLRFKRDCGPCIPDLAIETEKNQTIRLGTSTYPLNVTIKNQGRDPAYGVTFSVTLPEGINFNDLQVESRRIQCEDAEEVEDKKTRTVCKTVFSEFSNTSVSVITLTLDTKGLSPFGAKNEVILNVSSTNAEVGTYKDNVVTVPLTIKATADLALSGSFKTRQEFYGGEIKGESAVKYDDEIGHVVKHRYYVLNYGPDLLPSAVVTLHWPSEAVSGKHLLYLTNVETENAECSLKPGQVNERNFRLRFANATSYLSRQDSNRKRVRKEIDVEDEPKASAEAQTELGTEPGKGAAATTATSGNSEVKPSAIEEGSTSQGSLEEKSGMEGKVLDCRKKTAKCITITCEVKNFKKGGNAYITLTSRIWNSTFLMDYHGDVITVVSFAEVTVGSNVSYIKDEDFKNNDAELYTVIRPDFPAKIIEKIAVWKIALAILAGLILLALLIFGFYKVGFFNRRRGSQIRKKNSKVDGAEDSLLGSKKS